MASPLAGSLARTIGKAFAGIFLPATLTRGTVTYPCKAIFSQWEKYPGVGSVGDDTYKVLILATSLATEPAQGDQVTLQGSTITIFSGSRTRGAVQIDPARAVWTVLGGVSSGGGTNTGSGGTIGAAQGSPFDLYRSSGSNPLTTTPITTVSALFTSAGTTGFAINKSIGFDSYLFNGAFDETVVHVGDYLVAASGIYFVAAIQPLLPPSCVLCNATISLVRPNSERNTAGGQSLGMPSQPGSTGTYRGASPKAAVTGAGVTELKSGIPCAMAGTTGRATGGGELPTDAPGPSRWRIYLPQSAFPKGSVEDRDIVIDEFGARFQVSAAGWTALGYRLETIRLES